MNRLITIVALMCAVAFQVNAQNSVEQALKEAEAKAKFADKNLTNGKAQLEAANAIIGDSLGEKRDFDRALTYANRALKIAQEHPAPQDTLLALTCQALGMIYMGKQDMEKSMDFFERALDAFEVELGRFDPVTNGNKLAYGTIMAFMQPSSGFPKIVEAMTDNARAPQGQRIQNMGEAEIALEMALEMFMAEMSKHFRHALPTVVVDGKRYIIMQTSSWNMERPLVGWVAQDLMSSDEKDNETTKDDTILYGEDGTFKVLTDEDDGQLKLLFNFGYYKKNRNLLQFNDGEARLLFPNDEAYNQLIAKFREFKAASK